MNKRERGAISLVWAVILAGVFAAIAMAALFSIRHDRDLLGEAIGKVGGAIPAPRAQPAALRKCVVDGKTVVSNTDCRDDNKTSRTIEIHDSHGIEAPRKPAPQQAEPTSNPMIDKAIEKQLN